MRVDAWHDLVYHALSHLPVASGDASSLYDPRYVEWSDRQFAAEPEEASRPPRTLRADAAVLASLYDASEQGFLLHAWPTLWDDEDTFLTEMATDFAEMVWQDDARARLAAAIAGHVHPALPDLFRTALWGELRNGFEAVWRRAMAPRSQAYRGLFADRVAALAADVPGLDEVEWMLSLPLRVHGRVLTRPDGGPLIVVGVADTELGVEPWQPVMQGCHEHFVWSEQSTAPASEPWATAPGRPGYDGFRAVEDGALTAGAQTFLGSQWEEPYLAWLGRLFPRAPAAETAARLADGQAGPTQGT